MGKRGLRKSDTWFSEFERHNGRDLILSESDYSFVIGNVASYDGRQYPSWYNPSFRTGENTPEGQGFGHSLVIPKERIFNVVDPAARVDWCASLREMKEHFIRFWGAGGNKSIVVRTRLALDEQNEKLKIKNKEVGVSLLDELLALVEKGFDELSCQFMELQGTDEDFQFGFHAWPDNSVGHLHMHVFPKGEGLRRYSSRVHDKKTIPLGVVLDVEREDGQSTL